MSGSSAVRVVGIVVVGIFVWIIVRIGVMQAFVFIIVRTRILWLVKMLGPSIQNWESEKRREGDKD
jgi:hypothetical protein